MASKFFEASAKFKEQGAKFSFKFKVADLKIEKFTKFTSQQFPIKLIREKPLKFN